MTSHSLVCPFLTDDPAFAAGVEFGLLYARMRDGGDGVIADFYQRENQDRILLLVSRLGWRATKVEPRDRCWFWCEMENPAVVG